MTNTLSHVTYYDSMRFRDTLNFFIRWYFRNADEIKDLADYLGETEDDVVSMMLTNGMRKIEEAASITREAEKIE